MPTLKKLLFKKFSYLIEPQETSQLNLPVAVHQVWPMQPPWNIDISYERKLIVMSDPVIGL